MEKRLVARIGKKKVADVPTGTTPDAGLSTVLHPVINLADADARNKIGSLATIQTSAPGSIGYRQKNLLNLRVSTNAWVGKQPSSNGFEVFDTFEHGLRAAMITLRSYREKHGKKTLREIISRWAPPADGNDTEKYIANVAKWTGFDPDSEIMFTAPNISVLCWAMAQMECSTKPDYWMLENAWKQI